VRDRNKRWSSRIVFRYLLFQVPELGIFGAVVLILQDYGIVSFSLAWSLVALWAIKDVVLYPFVWRAYEGKVSDDPNPLIGATAIVQQRLDPTGYIRVRGELWKAELKQGCPPVEKDEKVRVRAIYGLILSVDPLRKKESEPEGDYLEREE
jgi:membrane protein implicated in regulation of membrane protease activity